MKLSTLHMWWLAKSTRLHFKILPTPFIWYIVGKPSNHLFKFCNCQTPPPPPPQKIISVKENLVKWISKSKEGQWHFTAYPYSGIYCLPPVFKKKKKNPYILCFWSKAITILSSIHCLDFFFTIAAMIAGLTKYLFIFCLLPMWH